MKLLNSCVIALALSPSLGLAKTYFCQFSHSGGLEFSKDGWVTKSFKLPPSFHLIIRNEKIVEETVRKPLGFEATCRLSMWKSDESMKLFHCHGPLGRSLSFDEATRLGTLFSNSGSPNRPGGKSRSGDRLMVSAFKCGEVND
jgi:hypothetical protein